MTHDEGELSQPELCKGFQLLRKFDVSGVSGTGIVADGWWWPYYELAIVQWRGDWPTINIHWKGIDSVRGIHAHGGATVITWNDAEPSVPVLDLVAVAMAMRGYMVP